MSSDETTKPSVPDAKAIADKIVDAAPSQASRDLVRSTPLNSLKAIDRTVLRLNKLLASPGGLSAFLSTTNYGLYVLAYLYQNPTLSNYAQRTLALLSASPAPSYFVATPTAAVSPITALALLISKARITLRLFGLFPLYAWLRTLVSGAKPGADVVLHRIAVLQASSYFAYQALENVSLLVDSGIVPSSLIAKINSGDSKTARVYLFAYRLWLGGVACDFLRLAREWQLESGRRVVRQRLTSRGHAVAEGQESEDAKFDKTWWADLMIACAWAPIAGHFSSSTGGIPGWNVGWMGVCGLVAGSTRMKALWDATA